MAITEPKSLAASSLEVTLACESVTQPGDLVIQRADSIAEPATDNKSIYPVIGWVKEKKSPTTALVVLQGVVTDSYSASLAISGRVYLSSVGGYATTPPPTGTVQVIGYALGQNRILIDPITPFIRQGNT